jgi:ATP-dependent DNA ligase
MKCYPFEEKRLAKWTPPFIVQPKYDGVRCRAYPSSLNPGDYMLLSSEENVIFSVPHILNELKRLRLNAELDGELYLHGMSFESILSITSRTVNLHPDASKIQFHVFDIVNRLSQMQRIILIENLRNLSPCIKVAPFWICDTLDEVTHAYDSVIKEGYEGIIVRNCEGSYETKRSTWVMKFKPKQKDQYTIVGYQEEVTKDGTPKGRLGSLELSSQEGERFSVSAGLDSYEKFHLWSIRHKLIGLEAIVSYQHLTDRKVPKGSFNIEVLYGHNR